ncbi:aldo/keto reductase [Alginatibacterium sediminis]|uniref:Aldo/keto reductase n=1 Tax=Alginatibacterium sediminis TaxID=2164068 RepID=A0A420EI41_9ALTE|nr:aldo/keto reductase [Alginatibacterium sediminis]RKF20330.1 aldo/keto reductase [Alginatibacterium sediminis]
MQTRQIGPWQVSPLGMGCWAIAGPFWDGENPLGWGEVDDSVSIQAIHAGLDAGINFMDTADLYGAGHSERVIAKALQGKRDQVILATKFGNTFDESSKQITGQAWDRDYIQSAVDASLRRLETDYIDLLWFHINDFAADEAQEVALSLEAMVASGKIRKFGWSTDYPERAAVFAKHKNCVGFQFEFNVVTPSPMPAYCDQHDFAGVIRGPLGMGLLSGKYQNAQVLSPKDIRSVSPDWMKYFDNGLAKPILVKKIDAIGEILRSEGRSSVQGALAWIWATSPRLIPIPGFRNTKQITETAAAMEYGPLSAEQMAEITRLLKD